ncbi:MAG: hypothetical protein IPG78_06935 [Ignavibacteria bacterium]|nr:hypothetical protein [Ignavibacteria bacterium]
MPGTRLIKILKTLSTDEMNSFGVFLHSPFFKRSRNTIGLYYYLLDIHPEFKEELLDQIKVFKNYFQKKILMKEGFEILFQTLPNQPRIFCLRLLISRISWITI